MQQNEILNLRVGDKILFYVSLVCLNLTVLLQVKCFVRQISCFYVACFVLCVTISQYIGELHQS
jgi:hypothetical protein